MQELIRTNEVEDGFCVVEYTPQIPLPEGLLPWLQAQQLVRGEAFGRPIPRSQRWFQAELLPYGTEWSGDFPRWKPHPIPPILEQLRRSVERSFVDRGIPARFNGILLNVYYSGQDHMRFHQDLAGGADPTVAVVSVGAERDMEFKRVIKNPQKPLSLKIDPGVPVVRQRLASGSMLVMRGKTQTYYCHGIPPDETCEGVRYSMTFQWR